MLHTQQKIYRLVEKSNVSCFPIDVMTIQFESFYWAIMTKSTARNNGLLNTGFFDEYSKKHKAFTLDMGVDGAAIIYDDFLASDERNILVGHEIGHVVFGHIAEEGIIRKSSDLVINDGQETEANYFTMILHTLPCVLLDEDIIDPYDISKTTAAPMEISAQAAGEVHRLKLTKRSKIEKSLSKKFNTKRYRILQVRKRLSIVSSVALVICFSIYMLIGDIKNKLEPITFDAPSVETLTNEPTGTELTTDMPIIGATSIPDVIAMANDGLALISITSPTGRNKYATVTVKGSPNIEYDIDVHYPSGISKAAGLENKISDENGNVSWTWKIGGNTTKGTHYLDITGSGKTLKIEFEVE